jgi:osmotically-inducible protein OsmY
MRILIVVGLVMLAGCSREDGERLARVGRLAGEKVRDAAPPKTPLGDLNPEATPAGRVRARFRTDATLADQPIQVQESSDGIHLRGRVATPEQAEWAVKLAQETTGVTNVVSELAVTP